MVSPRFTQGGVSERWGEALPEGGKDGYNKRGKREGGSRWDRLYDRGKQ